MTTSTLDIPLYVDLDGTLIKTDLLFEGLFLLLRKNLLYLFVVPLWLLQGRARLKAEIAKRVSVNAELLPVNTEFLTFLKEQKSQGRQLVLISASDQRAVSAVAEGFGLFDESLGSDGNTNLKAEAKLKRIQQLVGGEEFAYAGNSRADLPIWQQASEVLRVNCDPSLGAAATTNKTQLSFDRPVSYWPFLWRAMRPHQWLKNGLLFIPLVLAHQIQDLHRLEHAVYAFICFSLVASSVYLLNDLLDLESDRRHPTKKERALAAGNLPLQIGFVAVPVLLMAAFLLAHVQPLDFFIVLSAYWLLTLLYSFVLKKLFLVDVITLAGLYTLRLLAGAAAVSVQASPWLLAFSMSLFLGLAVVKRVTELVNTSNQTNSALPGRAYTGQHVKLLAVIGVLASLAAVLVFAFYINAEETAMLYSSPITLWPICGLLFLVLYRIWNFAIEGKLQDDPVLFAVSDHPSQVATVLMFVVLWLAI
ncbi:MAG: UbiA family prenyltransferase [Pseudomonadales bacterium]|nr:UbiA family prenyltransferase [Pseudomonadales bacterium]